MLFSRLTYYSSGTSITRYVLRDHPRWDDSRLHIAHFLQIICNDSHSEWPREQMFWSKQRTSEWIQALPTPPSTLVRHLWHMIGQSHVHCENYHCVTLTTQQICQNNFDIMTLSKSTPSIRKLFFQIPLRVVLSRFYCIQNQMNFGMNT
jgi:hypothetical protein